MCLIEDVLIAILSTYIFILLLKLYFLWSIRKSLKLYIHSKNDPDPVIFYINYDKGDFIAPIPRICLNISRKHGEDNEDWEGKYFSDMLNPYRFTGIYYKDRISITEDNLGWHELILFPEQKVIALMLHYVEKDEYGKKSWKTSDGYFIYRKEN